MVLPLALFLGTLALTLALTVPAYVRLLHLLETDHPDDYEALGRPTLWMASPRRSLALQRFVYRDSRASHVSERVARLCRFLAIATPVLVSLLLVEMAWALAALPAELARAR